MKKRRSKRRSRRRRGFLDPQGYRRSILAQGVECLVPDLAGENEELLFSGVKFLDDSVVGLLAKAGLASGGGS